MDIEKKSLSWSVVYKDAEENVIYRMKGKVPDHTVFTRKSNLCRERIVHYSEKDVEFTLTEYIQKGMHRVEAPDNCVTWSSVIQHLVYFRQHMVPLWGKELQTPAVHAEIVMALVHDSCTSRTTLVWFGTCVLKLQNIIVEFHFLFGINNSQIYAYTLLTFKQNWNLKAVTYFEKNRLLFFPNQRVVICEGIHTGFKLSDIIKFSICVKRWPYSLFMWNPYVGSWGEMFRGRYEVKTKVKNSHNEYIKQTVVSFLRCQEANIIQQNMDTDKTEKVGDQANDDIDSGQTEISMLRELVTSSRYLSLWDTNDILCFMMKQPNTMMENTLFRLASYASWPKHAPTIYSSYLVDAGFYFDLNTKSILCFHCGLCVNISDLKSQSSRDTLVKLHVQYSRNCSFAQDKLKELEGSINDQSSDLPVTTTDYSISSNNSCVKPYPSSATICFSNVPNPTAYPKTFQTTMEAKYDVQKFPVQTSSGGMVQTHTGLGTNIGQTPSEMVRPQSQSVMDSLALNPSSILADSFSVAPVLHMNPLPMVEVSQKISSKVFQNIDRQYNYSLKHHQYRDPDKRLVTFQSPDTPEILQNKCTEIVQAGFFYTGDRDIVRCFCCDIGLAEWMEEDIAWDEHAKHSPGCLFLKEEKGEEFINRMQEEWAKIYCPKHPAYNDYNTRLRSFEQFPEYVTQSHEDIADAGFFYTGEEDIVRCHYCDGGLKEFEPGDIPWVEHAKWFPFCKYLMKIKGRDFVQSVSVDTPASVLEELIENDEHQAPSLPQVAVPASTSCEDSISSLLQHMGYANHVIQEAIAEYKHRTGSETFSANDIMNIILDREENISNEYVPRLQREPSNMVQQNQPNPIAVEFSTAHAQRRLYDSGYQSCLSHQGGYNNGSRYNQGQATPHSENVNIQNGRSINTQNSGEVNTLSQSGQYHVPSSSFTGFSFKPDVSSNEAIASIVNENREMRNKTLCVKCKRQERQILFNPCGHRLLCEQCSTGMKKCVSCGTKIKFKTKTFLS